MEILDYWDVTRYLRDLDSALVITSVLAVLQQQEHRQDQRTAVDAKAYLRSDLTKPDNHLLNIPNPHRHAILVLKLLLISKVNIVLV